MKTRVLHLLSSLDSGGIERYVLRVLRYMPNDLWDNHVLCKTHRMGDLESDYRQADATLLNCRQRYLNPFDQRRLYRILEKGSFDAVCDYTGDFAGVPLHLAQKAGVRRRIAFYRAAVRHFRSDPLRRACVAGVHRLVHLRATDILANSTAVLDAFWPSRRIDDPRFAVVQNGISIDLFGEPFDRAELRNAIGLPPGKKIVAHVGRFTKEKNHKTILDVAGALQGEHDIMFLLVGKGVPENIEPELRRFELNNVVCLPARNDIPRILQIADAFYFPSLTEGQPNALLEAMVAGVPIVASNIAPHLESFPSFLHEQLVDPNDVQASAQMILEAIRNRNLRAEAWTRMKNWARDTFDMDRRIPEFLERLAE